MKKLTARKYRRCKSGCDIFIGFNVYPQRRGAVLCKACFDKRKGRSSDTSKPLKFLVLLAFVLLVLLCMN